MFMKIKRAAGIICAAAMLAMLTSCGTSGAPADTDISVTAAVSQTETREPETLSVSSPAETEKPAPTTAAQTSETAAETSPEERVIENENILVVYFSATENTKHIAERMADSLRCEIYEITPSVPYTEHALNYNNPNSRASLEMNYAKSRPDISGSVENMEQYDVIFLGYPIWWGVAPKIMYTFMESYDFSGKTIVPFCTSHSSPIGDSAENLHELASDSTVWLDGERFRAGTSREEIAEWINGLGLDVTAE